MSAESTDARSATRRTPPRRSASWSAVRVEDVCIHESASASEPRAICATVRLPNMLPTEVVVELALHDCHGRPIGPAEARRMWSEQAYDPGRFMFVVRVSPDDLEQTVQATVTVHAGRSRTRRSPVRATIPIDAATPAGVRVTPATTGT